MNFVKILMKRNRITFAHLCAEVSGSEGIVDLGHDCRQSKDIIQVCY